MYEQARAAALACGDRVPQRRHESVGVFHRVGMVEGLGVPESVRRQRWVQAAVRLAPGNSGGPIADADGRVIGVSAMIVGGLGLAVPAPEVEGLWRGGRP